MTSSISTQGQAALSLAERVVATFLEKFAAVLVAAGGIAALQAHGRIPWASAADQAGYSAAAALITGTILIATGLHLANVYLDMALRVGLTGLQSLAGTFAAAQTNPSLVHFGWSPALYVSLLAMLAALGKALIGGTNPGTVGASVLVPVTRHQARRAPHRG